MAKVTVTKNTYTMEPVYQWDLNQVLEIHGMSFATAPEVHFANDGAEYAIVRKSTLDAAGVIRVNVPNSLLQKAQRINVYLCTYEGSAFQTVNKFVMPVQARNCPADYSLEDEYELYDFTAMDVETVILENGAEPMVEKMQVGDKFVLRFGLPEVPTAEEVRGDIVEATLEEARTAAASAAEDAARAVAAADISEQAAAEVDAAARSADASAEAAQAAQAAAEQARDEARSASAADHIADKNNPHGVTAAQAGAVALDGSGTITGNLNMDKENPSVGLKHTPSGAKAHFMASEHEARLQITNVDGNESNRRYLQVNDSTGRADVNEAVTLVDVANGTAKGYFMLHSGNFSNYAVKRNGGDTMTGALNINSDAGDVSATIFTSNGSAQFRNKRSSSTFSTLVVPDGNGDVDLQFIKYRDGATAGGGTILHTGNKPSGSYTGNGSATERTIETGGIGKACLLWNASSGNSFLYVTPTGAMGKTNEDTLVAFNRNTIRFENGLLKMAKNDAAFNSNGSVYGYQVL